MIYSKKDRTVFLEDECPFLDLIPQKHWATESWQVLFSILNSKEVIFFLCTMGRGRIIKSVF